MHKTKFPGVFLLFLIFLLLLVINFDATPSLAEDSKVHEEHANTSEQTTKRISVGSDGREANGLSVGSSISADGRYVAFYSAASNLVEGDTNNERDVFVHDLQTNDTIRVSVSSDGMEANAPSDGGFISGSGRYIAFESFANNLVENDTNNASDIFLHDTQTNETIRVSIDSNGTQANSGSYEPSVSTNGRYVLFYSYASNLVNSDINDRPDVFLHDRETGKTILVPDINLSIGDSGRNLRISANGCCMVFVGGSDVVEDDTNNAADVFVHDLQTDETVRMSVASNGTQANSGSMDPFISADGQYVAFISYASNLVEDDTNNENDVFVHDLQTGETMRVSVASSGEQANSSSFFPSISTDGRYVVYSSYASNLTTDDTNDVADIFLRDLLTNEIIRVSVAHDGTQTNSHSFYYPSISASGNHVAFVSDASNLIENDTNNVEDVFVYTIPINKHKLFLPIVTR